MRVSRNCSSEIVLKPTNKTEGQGARERERERETVRKREESEKRDIER